MNQSTAVSAASLIKKSNYLLNYTNNTMIIENSRNL